MCEALSRCLSNCDYRDCCDDRGYYDYYDYCDYPDYPDYPAASAWLNRSATALPKYMLYEMSGVSPPVS